MASAEFAPLADALASDHTVVTYDPRGYAGSPVDDPDAPSGVEQRADDVNAILDDLGAESADLFGSSGGAVTGLALVTRSPGRIGTLVAHEPPLLGLLPDAATAAREHRGHHRHLPPRRVRGRLDALHATTPGSTSRPTMRRPPLLSRRRTTFARPPGSSRSTCVRRRSTFPTSRR